MHIISAAKAIIFYVVQYNFQSFWFAISEMMKESKLTNFQQRQLDKTLKGTYFV